MLNISEQTLPFGKHSIELEGSQLSKGGDYYRLIFADFNSTKKMHHPINSRN